MVKIIKAIFLVSVVLLGAHYFLGWEYWKDYPMHITG